MNHRKCGIYRIYCTTNRECYIGSSYQISVRCSQHRSRLRKGNHSSPYLQNAWNKYGQEAFTFKVLEECEPEQLLEREQYWMDSFNPKLNGLLKAKRSVGQFKPESIEKISTAAKKLWEEASPEKRAKMQSGLVDYIGSEEHKANTDAARLLRDTDKLRETCRRIGLANKGRKQSPEEIAARMASMDIKTHCPHGHEYTLENTMWRKNRGVTRTRVCRICKQFLRHGGVYYA